MIAGQSHTSFDLDGTGASADVLICRIYNEMQLIPPARRKKRQGSAHEAAELAASASSGSSSGGGFGSMPIDADDGSVQS